MSKSKFHHTVSRRNFMKGLGLAGAGLGAAAATVPVFHDLDEAMSAPIANRTKLPWYVKENEFWNFTTEVDWNLYKTYDAREMTFNPYGQAKALAVVGVDTNQGWQDAASNRKAQYKADQIGGYAQRDEAWNQGNSFTWNSRARGGAPNVGFMGPRKAKTPAEMGYAKWSGTPEENSAMVRLFLRFTGATEIGIFEADPAHGRKFVYGYDYYDGKKYTWADVDDGYETGGDTYNGTTGGGHERVIPEKCRTGIVWLEAQSEEGMKRAKGGFRYFQGRHQQESLQDFLRALGYQAYGPPTYPNEFGATIPMGIASGLGELGRNNNILSPIYPATTGTGSKVITDFPLAPDKPIDAGIQRFCKTCKTCADKCPGDALGSETEPDWESETSGPWNNLGGYKHYWYNPPKCRGFRDLEPCFTWGCAKWCPFANKQGAVVHDLIQGIVAVTPLFNSFLVTMNDVFGYGPHDAAGWWDLTIPPHGVEHFGGKTL